MATVMDSEKLRKKKLVQRVLFKIENQAKLEGKTFDKGDMFFKLAFMNNKQLELILETIGA